MCSDCFSVWVVFIFPYLSAFRVVGFDFSDAAITSVSQRLDCGLQLRDLEHALQSFDSGLRDDFLSQCQSGDDINEGPTLCTPWHKSSQTSTLDTPFQEFVEVEVSESAKHGKRRPSR